MTLSNEYEKLLGILNEEKEKSKSSDHTKQSKSKQNNQEKNSESIEKSSKIEEYQDLNFDTPQISSSFDVKKFESNLRQKLISNYDRIRTYKKPYIWVTECFSCIRKSYYERLSYSPDKNKLFTFPYLYLIQEAGKRIHDIIPEMYEFSEVEKVVKSDKYKVKGRVDAITKNTVFEMKTVDRSKIKQGYVESHYNQGIIYSYILNNEYDYNINSLEIIYIPRDLKSVIVKKLDIDFNKAKEFLNSALILNNHIKDNKVPDTINSTKEECQFCHFIKYCEKDNEIKIKEENKTKTTFLLGG